MAARFADVGLIAPGPGAGILELRSTIVDFDAPSVVTNVATTMLIGPVTTGGAAVEFEAIDSATGGPIALWRGGHTGSVVKNLTASYMKLGDAKKAMASLAKQWRAYLGEPQTTETQK